MEGFIQNQLSGNLESSTKNLRIYPHLNPINKLGERINKLKNQPSKTKYLRINLWEVVYSNHYFSYLVC
jgi:hypothetical protein